ncbi:MAG: SHOCT domain-containing protein [Arhodomonas sp.]|nr:SHOCT domain-containing protein [Arhodomonas sp.]
MANRRAGDMTMWDGMRWHMNGMGWGWLGFGVLHMVIFWALIIAAVVVVVRFLAGGRSDNGSGDEHALQILQRRYASGEIDDEEFERRRQQLTDNHRR